MTLLLKSASRHYQGRHPLEELASTGAHRALGDFLRAVRDIAELERSTAEGSDALPVPEKALPRQGGASHPAEWEARRLREQLGLGISPIPSMRALLTGMGVRLFFTTPDELDSAIEGASTRAPCPAVLVNLIGGGGCFWRTRMTLAHELAHLLFDSSHGWALFSPHGPFLRRPRGWRWQLFKGFDDIEVHADAFAACFLAPADGVRRSVGPHDPTSEVAIAAVGATFGVGRTVAINRLQHVFNLSHEQRIEMESRSRSSYQADSSDRVEAGIGIRGGLLPQLVAEALRHGRISRVRAREYLGVSPIEDLPIPELPEELRRPILGRERWIVDQAQRYLSARGENLYPLRVEPAGTGWRVSVGSGGVGDATLVGSGALILDGEGKVVDDQVGRATLDSGAAK
jgi:hypothetical protein